MKIDDTLDMQITEEEISTFKKPKCLFDKITVNFYSIVCFTMSILLMLMIGTATMLRYIFRADLYGYEEWVRIFAFWLYFMGAAYGTFTETHISADLVQSYLSDGITKKFFVFLKSLITFAITLLFTKYAWDYFLYGYLGPLGTRVKIPRTVAWRIPLCIGYLAIFTGLISMSYYFLWELIRASKQIFSGGKKS